MDTIKINEKEYVSIEDYNKVKQDYDNLCLRPKESPTTFKDLVCVAEDEANVMGLVTLQLQGEWVKVTISKDYLLKAIKIMDMISIDKKGRDSFQIIWTKDYPVLIGGYNESKNRFVGLAIAPRIE